MAKRSKVALYEEIRRARADEQASIRELSRRFRVHRRDVRAALASPVPAPRKQPATPRPSPKLDEWKPLIDRWLADDEHVPRKQSHTARRVWQRLVLEHGADIGESTVRETDIHRLALDVVPEDVDAVVLAQVRKLERLG